MAGIPLTTQKVVPTNYCGNAVEDITGKREYLIGLLKGMAALFVLGSKYFPATTILQPFGLILQSKLLIGTRRSWLVKVIEN
jgi:hypothetical protein